LAKEEHISINQTLLASALGETFLAALNRAPDVEPPEYDRVPDDLLVRRKGILRN
jgi:hypothetical protein